MNSRILRISLAFLLVPLALLSPTKAVSQIIDNVVVWKGELKDDGTAIKTIALTAKVEKGWHFYDQNMPADGPNSLEFEYYTLEGARKLGDFKASKAPHEEYDKAFGMTLRWYEGVVTFSQQIEVTDPAKFKAELAVVYSACNDQGCLPPTPAEFTFTSADLKSTAAAKPMTATPQEEQVAQVATTPEASEATEPSESVLSEPAPAEPTAQGGDKLWEPMLDVLTAYGDETSQQADSSLIMIFVYGFIGGLIALMTPCVWPMIPMTVSFFLKRTKKRKEAIKDAVTYGLSIIVIYLVLGIAITLIFGASALNSLSTNAFFNLLFFAILVLFAISFFGAFEITMPSKWTNKMDSKADSSRGLLSIFFMAFTLTLVSFSCTGPIIGTLLVQAATMGSILGPAIGMFGFALALALPFSLFAVFPNMLQNLPKSGGWLNSVKVVMAFLELALSLKFLSVADMAYGWGILSRETFLALWIAIFALMGVYLLGKIRFPHDTPLEKVGVGRFFLALISFSFAIYLVPGLWGAPLKAVSAFSPPIATQDFNLYDGSVHAKFDDYEEGMRYAKRVNKPVLVDFSGWGCVNCREMEASVWIDPTVKKLLEEDYVLITLMVDDKTRLPEMVEVDDFGKTRKLRTIGDKWSYLQRYKFGANAQPFYVPLDPNGVPLGPSFKRELDVAKYTEFLRNGLREFKERTEKSKPIPTITSTQAPKEEAVEDGGSIPQEQAEVEATATESSL